MLSYVVLVAHAWFAGHKSSLPEPLAGQSDFSRLNSYRPTAIITVDHDPAKAVEQLRDLVRQTASQHGKITIAGSRHSMGRHTLLNGSLCIDMRCGAFRRIDPVRVRDSVPIVQHGCRRNMARLLTALDRQGWSVAVMQSMMISPSVGQSR